MPAKFALFPVDESGRPILPFDENGKSIPPDQFIIKLSRNLKPFVSRVVTSGEVQKRFAEQYGKPIGNCVKANVHKGMSQSEIHDVVRKCSERFRGTPMRMR